MTFEVFQRPQPRQRERLADARAGRRRIGADEPPRTWVDDAIDNLRASRARTRRIGR